MRRSTLRELAGRAGIVATLPSGYGSFAAFTETITGAAACLRTPADARNRFGVGFGLVVAANRDRPPEEAVALAELAVRHRDHGVVGFGLDGDETAAPGRVFAEAFTIARNGGLLSVPHAGELTGAHSVREALDVLGADRVMHGVAAVADPALLDRLTASNVALDVCPTSNVLLSVVPTIAQHPLPALLAGGVPCSINADDPLLFDTDLLTEYTRARDRLHLTDAQLAECARTSLRHSGALPHLVEPALAAIDVWLQRAPA